MKESKQLPAKKRIKEEPGAKALGRGLKLLSCFSVDKPYWTVSELSEHLDLPKSSVHRIVCAHVNHGFLDKEEDSKRYYLGLKIFALSEAVAQRRFLPNCPDLIFANWFAIPARFAILPSSKATSSCMW